MPDDLSLTAIAVESGTDKAGLHGYTDFYDSLLGSLRDKPIRLLEIGVGGDDDPLAGGNSLRMWKAYFPQAEIVGLDYFDKSAHAEERISIYRGDQGDDQFLNHVVQKEGPFDVIIDDGSHLNHHMRSSFETLFPTLSPSGIYIIEDLQTSYWPEYGGRIRLGSSSTIMGLVKQRMDGLHHAEFRLPRFVPSNLDESIVEIRMMRNSVAFIKGDNTRPSTMNHSHPLGFRGWIRKDLKPQLGQLLDRIARFRPMHAASPDRSRVADDTSPTGG